ncbi:Peroxidase, family 2 [Rhizoctonia solani]|uniref:Peroxidase, family 2 n=1 Tax=Rhizoctonia solani TaxID=456999 RepID=A0A8H7IIB1_9AGAM|nr:Peroxidase, family 2 [Rhizoctonia solani]
MQQRIITTCTLISVVIHETSVISSTYTGLIREELGALQLCKAVHDLYGLSYPLAAIFAFGGVLICGSKGKLDLADLAKAHKIEHDASLAHMDLADGDNKNVSAVG